MTSMRRRSIKSESPTKEKKSPKGANYEEVAFGFDDAKVFAPRSTIFGPRFQMTVSLLAGVLLMLLHHFFCTYLDGKAVDSQGFAIRGFGLNNQSASSIISNAIAYVTHAVLSAGIGIAFIQILWSRLRRQQYSVKQIDAMVACNGDPFAPSALPAWHYAFWLAAVAAMASLMAFISIIAPGFLRVDSSERSFSTPCIVPTVSLQTANLASYAINSTDGSTQVLGAFAGLMGLAKQVLMNGVTLQARNPCDGACQYEINFNAPFASCTPMALSATSTNWLPPPDNATAPLRVWKAGSDLSTEVYCGAAARDLSNNVQSAVNCTILNATHFATVTHSNISTSLVHVNRIDVHEVLDFGNGSSSDGVDFTTMQYYAIVSAFLDIQLGTVNYFPDLREFNGTDNLFVAYSTSFAGSMGKPWASSPDLQTALPSLLRNISLSLPNDELSEGENSTTANVDSACHYASSAYHYVKVRLLATYGAALVIAAACVVFGYLAIRMNGCEESVTFSRLLGAILNKPLFDDRYALSRSSKLTADGSADGQLKLLSTTDD